METSKRRETQATLVTGATGFLGGLIAAGLLENSSTRLILPIRSHHSREKVLDHLRAFSHHGKGSEKEAWDPRRIVTIGYPDSQEWDDLIQILKDLDVEEIIHCAACMDYFDTATLKAVNIDLTARLLNVGRRLEIQRFVHLSTAFSCGFLPGIAPETLHQNPPEDPNDYTRTKREGEHLVAKSGLPFLIVRPSIVIGDSLTGIYQGKPTGIYQLLMGGERLCFDNYSPVLHLFAPPTALHLLHQDAFQEGFFAARSNLPEGSIVHLVSREAGLPTLLDLWEFWMERCCRPQEVYLYSSIEELPLSEIHPNHRMLMEYISANREIVATHPWRFASDHLEELRSKGLQFTDVTRESLFTCFERFMKDSEPIQKFLKTFEAQQAHEVHYISRPPVNPRSSGIFEAGNGA